MHDNTAEGEGGGLLIDSFGDGDVVAGNRIVGNTAEEGGGMSIGSDVLVAGNLVAGNTGAGIYGGNHVGRVWIVNSTIADNSGPGIVDSTFFGGFRFLIQHDPRRQRRCARWLRLPGDEQPRRERPRLLGRCLLPRGRFGGD